MGEIILFIFMILTVIMNSGYKEKAPDFWDVKPVVEKITLSDNVTVVYTAAEPEDNAAEGEAVKPVLTIAADLSVTPEVLSQVATFALDEAKVDYLQTLTDYMRYISVVKYDRSYAFDNGAGVISLELLSSDGKGLLLADRLELSNISSNRADIRFYNLKMRYIAESTVYLAADMVELRQIDLRRLEEFTQNLLDYVYTPLWFAAHFALDGATVDNLKLSAKPGDFSLERLELNCVRNSNVEVSMKVIDFTFSSGIVKFLTGSNQMVLNLYYDGVLYGGTLDESISVHLDDGFDLRYEHRLIDVDIDGDFFDSKFYSSFISYKEEGFIASSVNVLNNFFISDGTIVNKILKTKLFEDLNNKNELKSGLLAFVKTPDEIIIKMNPTEPLAVNADYQSRVFFNSLNATVYINGMDAVKLVK